MSHTPPEPSADAISRRRALRVGLGGGLAALGAAWLPGCVGAVPAYYATPQSAAGTGPGASTGYPAPPRPAAPVRVVRPAPPPPAAAAPALPVSMAVTPRSSWTRAAPGTNVRAMNGVSRITVHHSAMAMRGTSANETADMLESIREGHLKRGWADIGYHFAVDRGGRVLACRDVRYQGAHAAENNEHNVGVCVLGNFDEQAPAAAQLNALHAALTSLAAAGRVPMSRIHTHQELNPTACPGRSLQRHMVLARSGRA
ncbi:peptidoglycan recognition protein family protein [Phycisphaera mikurensis]|uniref:N-acetylmuramoyl-L-alanine amidase n=1 Tax=Phycisphaera mikurensis (strain NBRC 102666 / KCTC 22515 / FYK2301M01) TaxID=1142394 RepID=I0IBL5_PHYMF|nr:peptidoglycan recognition family protein [Phycisphaera mikurensis]MBB6442818.1 hypothetical protein [Phycisphaera mikurensis]BAM02653.1 N-acetylmuramoyl-L-alanine amidase [Phycisphaera mikurensis NBRC 102666]